MTAIGPGTMLECIDQHGTDVLRLGGVYECTDLRGMGQCRYCGVVGPGVWVAGYEYHDDHWGRRQAHCPRQFKPIGKKGDFDYLLVVEPVKEDA